MFPEVTEQILDIFHQTETDNGQVWKDYKSSLCALQDLMDRLPDEQYQIIDEYICSPLSARLSPSSPYADQKKPKYIHR